MVTRWSVFTAALALFLGPHGRFAVASFALSGVLVVAAFSYAASGVFSPDVKQQVVFETCLGWLVASAIVAGRRTT